MERGFGNEGVGEWVLLTQTVEFSSVKYILAS